MSEFIETIRLRSAARAMGLTVITDDSSMSRSQYLRIERADEEELTVRVSDHELPPSYGVRNGWADWEVGAGMPLRMDAVHWTSVAAAVAEWAGADLPPKVAAARADYTAAREARKAQAALLEAEQIARARAAAERRIVNDERLAAAGLAHLTGEKRKRAVKRLRRQAEATA